MMSSSIRLSKALQSRRICEKKGAKLPFVGPEPSCEVQKPYREGYTIFGGKIYCLAMGKCPRS